MPRFLKTNVTPVILSRDSVAQMHNFIAKLHITECSYFIYLFTKFTKKCMEHEVEGSRPKKTWKEVVREDCQARKLNKEDAMDRCKWRKMIKEAR